MVTRHLGGVLETADIVSCDIHEQAVEFIRTTLHMKAQLSRHVPEELQFDEPFDVVFALSLGDAQADVNTLGVAAAEAVAEAVVRAVRSAPAMGGLPGLA